MLLTVSAKAVLVLNLQDGFRWWLHVRMAKAELPSGELIAKHLPEKSVEKRITVRKTSPPNSGSHAVAAGIVVVDKMCKKGVRNCPPRAASAAARIFSCKKQVQL